MTIPQAVSQLLEIETIRQEGTLSPSKTLAIALSQVGGGDAHERIVCGTLTELQSLSDDAFGYPLHSLVIVGKRLHHMEVEFAEEWAVNRKTWRDVARDIYGCSLE
jgi:diphthine methyl ester synthase